MALQPCDILRAGFNGINALASRVLMALQPCDTLLTQCVMLKIDVCSGNGQEVSKTRRSAGQND